MSEDRGEIYRCRPPARLWVPILVHPLAVNDDIPEESEIEIAVLGLKGGRAGGSVGHAHEGPEGVAIGGQVREGSIEEKVGACGETSAGDV